MTENVTIEHNPPPDSTVLDTGAVDATMNGGGEVREPAKPEKPESVADSIRSVIKEADAKQAGEKDKPEEAKEAKTKVEEPVKTEKPRSENGKFAKAEQGVDPKVEADKGAAEKPASERVEHDDKRASEVRKYAEPPARLLPEERIKWANTPNEVKAGFHRIHSEYEAEANKSRATVERYETIRQFDEQARQNGRELKDSLTKMVQIEQALARNPVMGIEMILREVGPRKADGSPVSLHDIATHVAKLTPQQYAQNMGQMNQQSQQRQQQVDPKVAALEQKIAMMEGRFAEQAANPIIERFASSHPDYHGLEQSIADVLKSGIIEKLHGAGLTPEQRLEQAYRIAGGQGPSSHADPAAQAPASAPPKDRLVDPAGQKSITGSLNSRGDDPDDDAEEDTDIRTLLRKGVRKAV